MDNTSRKNIRRRQESANVRCNRIVTGYVETNYPEVYAEAQQFYHSLDTAYPHKKDLRRTNEYAWMKDGSLGKKYYLRKAKETTTKHKVADNMRLVIPLMETPKNTNEDVMESTQELSVMPNGEPTQELPVMPNDEPTQELSVMPNDEPTQEFPVMPEEKIEEIIKELSKDPDLNQVFRDFDVGAEVELEDFMFDIDTETPLERELLLY